MDKARIQSPGLVQDKLFYSINKHSESRYFVSGTMQLIIASHLMFTISRINTHYQPFYFYVD
jgi:hypothetical protein